MTNPNMETSRYWSVFYNAIRELKEISVKNGSIPVLQLDNKSRKTAQLYFRRTRLKIEPLNVNSEILHRLDERIQNLLRLSSNKRSTKKSYQREIENILRCVRVLDSQIEVKTSQKAIAVTKQTISNSDIEKKIINELQLISPMATNSYQQALLDLADVKRISFRGTANELRESLRETLDILAPDKEVTAQGNFKLEQNTTSPTMKQKVRFILRKRGLSDTAIKVPEHTIENIEASVSNLVRAVYNRTSISAHVSSSHSEVMKIKNYIDAIFTDLFEIHQKLKI
jgi:hypothetical protein